MNIYLIYIFLLWLISPVGSIFVMLFISNQLQLSKSNLKFLSFLIAASLALLAFTQKSISVGIDTDIQRYYDEFSYLEGNSINILPLLFSDNLLTYTFTFINAVLVIASGNVQMISLFWIFVIYYFHFNTFWIICEKEGIELNKTNIFLILVFSIFGAILFTQITETIKNAVAITLFFYVLIKHIYGWPIYKTLISLFLIIGIHSMVLMLIPMFFYKKFNYKVLTAILILVFFTSPFINIMTISTMVIPDVGFFSLLREKALDYSDFAGETSSKRYIIISFVLLIYSFILQKKNIFNNNNKYINIVLLYMLLMWINYNNSHAFIRFANFAHFFILWEFILLHKEYKLKSTVLSFFFIFFLLTNLQMTKGRTTPGNYASSYMDNSIAKVLFSNVYDYLKFEAY